MTWIHFRRASIATVKLAGPGDVAVEGDPGTLTLRGLGASATRMHDTLAKLRDGAFADAAGFVDQLMTDAPFGVRQKASDLLVDGRPVRPEAFGDTGWPIVEPAVLGEPTFAESYQSLCSTAGSAAPRWVAMSPEDPGSEKSKVWFLVAMPGNLVALELVSAGAHATYFYRVMPRPQYKGEPPRSSAWRPRRPSATSARRWSTAASCASRWRCRPTSSSCLSTCATGSPSVLPSLAGRGAGLSPVSSSDPAAWSAAVADLVRWHSTATDESAEWPGRTAQKQVSAAGGDGDEDSDAGDAEGGTAASGGPGGPAAGTAKKSKPSGTPG